jgi:guanosine-3',5'-bis(diphosphate) 3'-pyrophosphohydrolase
LFVSIKIRRSVDIIGPQRRNGMPGAGVEAKMEGCAMLPAIRLVSEAAEFAAHRHTGTARKARPDEPYVNHLAEVANLLAFATDGADAELVAAGWLHDTVEDTETTREELAQKFGERVASLVVEVTDDMNLSQTERRQRQIEDAPHKSPGAKLIKIADKISNIRARIVPNPALAQRSDLAAYAIWAEKVVAGCRGVNARLDAEFDETVEASRRLF